MQFRPSTAQAKGLNVWSRILRSELWSSARLRLQHHLPVLVELDKVGKRGPEAHRFPRRPRSRLEIHVEEAILDRQLRLPEDRE